MVHSCHSWGLLADSARLLLEELSESSVRLALDDTGGSSPALDTSKIASEYFRSLAPQSYPLMLLASLAQFGQLVFVGIPAPAAAARIRRLVPRNAGDRTLVGTAVGTGDRLLVSNDEDDLPDGLREQIERELGVRIRWSWEVSG